MDNEITSTKSDLVSGLRRAKYGDRIVIIQHGYEVKIFINNEIVVHAVGSKLPSSGEFGELLQEASQEYDGSFLADFKLTSDQNFEYTFYPRYISMSSDRKPLAGKLLLSTEPDS